MKNVAWVIVLLIAFSSVAGCMNDGEDEKWHFKGYIIDEKEDQFLLVEGVSKLYISRRTVDQILETGATEAIWLGTKDIDETYTVGDKVYVWTTGTIETSYPASGTATKIKKARW